jgi:hypothetical protein
MHSGDGKAPAFPVNRSTLKDQRVRPFPNEQAYPRPDHR